MPLYFWERGVWIEKKKKYSYIRNHSEIHHISIVSGDLMSYVKWHYMKGVLPVKMCAFDRLLVLWAKLYQKPTETPLKKTLKKSWTIPIRQLSSPRYARIWSKNKWDLLSCQDSIYKVIVNTSSGVRISVRWRVIYKYLLPCIHILSHSSPIFTNWCPSEIIADCATLPPSSWVFELSTNWQLYFYIIRFCYQSLKKW